MGRHRFGSALTLVFVVCVSCAGPTDLAPASRSATSTPTASTTAASPRNDRAGFPQALVGDWRSLDQGTADVLYTICPDGTVDRAMVLMQSRSSGTFSYTIGMTGELQVSGSRLVPKPRNGIKSMHDPDSPSSDYQNRPLTDLSAETYSWSATDGTLSLDGKYGLVAYARE
ncbi:MAG TPA: hypothetical protein VIM10_09900 [Actinopolymorphaceae bacterium]